MTRPNGLHHVAISTGDMKGQIAYFSDVLGMKLQALYWMHGVPNTFHGFMMMGDEAVAFIFNEEIKALLRPWARRIPATRALLLRPAPCSTSHLTSMA